MSLVDILLKKNLISQDDIREIKKRTGEGESLDQILIEMGVHSEDVLAARGEFLNIPIKSLGDANVPFEALDYIPEESATHYRFVPIGIKEGTLEVGIVDPDNIEARDALNFIASKSNIPYKIFLISSTDYTKVIELYKGIGGEVSKALSELETVLSIDNESTVDVKKGKTEKDTNAIIIEDAPVVKIVATIVRYATEGNASDVHIEHMRDRVRVRFRVDGTLNTSLVLPPQVHSAVVARIKVLSNMKLDEKRKPQDGRFSARIDGRKIDFRVSTFPAYYGEKVVMRILDQEKGVKKIEEMGLSEKNLSYFKEAINKPYGLILITGPTGSGKSTTLYSMLNEVDREGANVLSLEDPIEYNMDGVSQSQVHPEIGYTFASGLRTTLRQDPDIIMVGEIRDSETAGIAVNTALTGHLLLSTLHTNDAATTLPRLLDMGIDAYLVASTVNIAIGQRLIRRICKDCREEYKLSDGEYISLRALIGERVQRDGTFYKGRGCASCGGTGYKGRLVICEVLVVDHDIHEAILKKEPASRLKEIAIASGMTTMLEDGFIKAAEGKTTVAEILRTINE
jgi:type IV pilus assembly protein PilB